jgi:hypothetical protein
MERKKSYEEGKKKRVTGKNENVYSCRPAEFGTR